MNLINFSGDYGVEAKAGLMIRKDLSSPSANIYIYYRNDSVYTSYRYGYHNFTSYDRYSGRDEINSDCWFRIVKNDKILNVVFLGTFTNSFEFETIFSAAKILQDKGAPVRFVFCGIGAKELKIKQSCEELNNCILYIFYAGNLETVQRNYNP